MSYNQEYPLKESLPIIRNHTQLPSEALDLGAAVDDSGGRAKHFVLVKRGQYLTVLVHYIIVRKDGEHYYCDQFDFPLKVLSWFPKTLDDFRRPPAEGGLHAGAMTTPDENVEGEMLCVQNATQGYYLVNRSRTSPLAFGDTYMATEVSLSYHLLYEIGFLQVWRELGEQYENGTI